MTTHDPLKILETLRNHLTQPDANVVFLFGAGTSCSVRIPVEVEGTAQEEPTTSTRSLIPNVAELTAICVKEIRKLDPDEGPKKFGTAYDSIELEIRPKDRPTNIEDVLSCLRRKVQAVGVNDTLSGLSASELALAEKTVRSTIAAQVNPELTSFPKKLPHEDFVRWLAKMPRARPVEIFTTNYDVLIETALEANRVTSFDGFVGCNRPFFCHESLTRPESAPGAAWTRLWKIHGSINWSLENVRGKARVVRTAVNNEGEMIMPSHHKYDESRKQPYSALLDRLTKALEREDAILVVCGYSFSDDHINAIIFDALEARRRPHVIALQYLDAPENSILSERAARHLNLMVLGPNIAYVGGRQGSWRLSDMSGRKQISQAFELSLPEDDSPPSGEGKFLLGDFAVFSAFAGSLARAN